MMVYFGGSRGHRSSRRCARGLSIVGAAYAEAGRFDEATTAARRAVELAEEGNAAELADEIRARLALYESGQAYREQP